MLGITLSLFSFICRNYKLQQSDRRRHIVVNILLTYVKVCSPTDEVCLSHSFLVNNTTFYTSACNRNQLYMFLKFYHILLQYSLYILQFSVTSPTKKYNTSKRCYLVYVHSSICQSVWLVRSITLKKFIEILHKVKLLFIFRKVTRVLPVPPL